MFTYASRDEHGRHYRSCATKWGWREDENRPPYKRPKAILQANAKTQIYYKPTFHAKQKDKGEPGKRTARRCTKPTSGHNLAFFDTGSFAPARPRPKDPPERADAGALKRPERTILHRRLHERNEGTRENPANEMHKRAQSQPRVTT